MNDFDSPHSVQTLCDCTIYETAQNPGGLSLLPLPVNKKHRSKQKAHMMWRFLFPVQFMANQLVLAVANRENAVFIMEHFTGCLYYI